MKLHDAAWAPSPRRVRIYLAEKGIALDRRVIDLKSREHLKDAYLAVNPRGVVPALELDSGEILCESVAICRYFEVQQPDPPLFGHDALSVARIESWTRRIEGDGYAAVVDVLRNRSAAFAGRAIPGKWPAIDQIPALVDRGRTMWDGFTAALDRRLADREWIAGDTFSFADITALVTIDFAVATKLGVPAERPNIARWHEAASARPSAQA